MNVWFWGVAVVILVLVVTRVQERREQSAFQNLLEGVASRVDGRLMPKTAFGFPRLVIEGTPDIVVSTMRTGIASSRSGRITYATLHLPAFDVKRDRFRIVRRQRSIQDAVDARIQESISLGAPQFERAFLIQCSDPSVLRALLDAELMQDLSSYPRDADVSLTLSCGECTVSRCNIAKSEDQIERLINTARRVRGRMGQLAGIER